MKLDWDGETDGKSDEELREIGKAFGLDFISVGTTVCEVGDWAVVSTFPRVAEKGSPTEWRPKHVLVATYSLLYLDRDIRVQSAIDPRWVRRGAGQNRVVFGGLIEETEKFDIF